MGARRSARAPYQPIRRVRPERLERRPPRVDRLLGVLVRLEVEVPPAGRAETCAIGPTEDLVGERERRLVARPGADVELAVRDVLDAKLLVRAGVGRLVLLRGDLDENARRRETPHARALESRREREAKEIA